MLSVKELCQLKGVTRKTLFYYDKIGLLIPSGREGKQKAKFYNEKAVERLEEIICLQNAGLTLAEIAQMIDLPEEQKAVRLRCAIDRMHDERTELDRKITAATELLEVFEEL